MSLTPRFTSLYVGFAAPSASAVLTGTSVPDATEAEIIAGGQTTIITLTNDTWLATGGSFDGQRQAIIDGFDSAQSEGTGWNAEVRDKEVVGSVARTSDTVVTITWTAAAAYAITTNETITCTVPNAALVTSGTDITATPTFGVLAAVTGIYPQNAWWGISCMLSPSSEPIYDAGSMTMVYTDDMEAYTDVVEMGALPIHSHARFIPHGSPLSTGGDVQTSEVGLVTGRGGTGTALQLKYSGAAQQGGTFLLYLPPVVSDHVATHVFQHWARINFSETGNTTAAVKWFMAFHKKDGGNGRIQWSTHDHLPCIAEAHPTYWQVFDKSGVATGCQANQPVGPYFEDLHDNNWHRYTYQYKPHSASPGDDAIVRMWIDGTKIIDISAETVGVTPPGGETTWCEQDDMDSIEIDNGIRNVRFGGVQTTVTDAWTLDVDDFRWWTL